MTPFVISASSQGNTWLDFFYPEAQAQKFSVCAVKQKRYGKNSEKNSRESSKEDCQGYNQKSSEEDC